MKNRSLWNYDTYSAQFESTGKEKTTYFVSALKNFNKELVFRSLLFFNTFSNHKQYDALCTWISLKTGYSAS